MATVNICTRNRSQSLKRTLDSIVAASKFVSDLWEIHVIDNGSTDDTAVVVSKYQDVLPIRRVDAPIAGLSNARNVGVNHANGEFIIWTDDDVAVSEAWLRSYMEAFKRADGHDIFGGKATPCYEEPKTAWFAKSELHLASLLAIRNEPNWIEVNETQLPWGVNYAVRASVQRKHLYDPELGVAPGRRRGGEETAMLKSALASGAKGIWVWEAEVMHMIPAQRQNASYIWDYYKATGNDWPVAGFDVDRRKRFPLKLIKSILELAFKAGVLWLMRDLRWVRHYVLLAQSYGNLQTLIRNESFMSS